MFDLGQRQLVFIRARSRIVDKIPESNPIFELVNSGKTPTIRTANTLLFPSSVPHADFFDVYSLLHSDVKLKEWAEFVEVLEIGDDTASAPHIFKSIDVLYQDDDGFRRREVLEYRESFWVERRLNSTTATTAPCFGRKMLIMITDENLEDRESERIRDKVTKFLGADAKGTWHGRGLLALCFVDHRSPTLIMERLSYLFDRQELNDCLVVQPMAVVLPNDSDLSPLDEWIRRGSSETLSSGTTLNRRTAARSIPVETHYKKLRKPKITFLK